MAASSCFGSSQDFLSFQVLVDTFGSLTPFAHGQDDGLRLVDDISGSKDAFFTGQAIRQILDGNVAIVIGIDAESFDDGQFRLVADGGDDLIGRDDTEFPVGTMVASSRICCFSYFRPSTWSVPTTAFGAE